LERIAFDRLLKLQFRQQYQEALELTATIAARTGAPEALDVLTEMLSDPKSDIRGEAMVTLYETYEWQGCEIPPVLLDRFWDAARSDRSRRVRQTSLAVLQRVGEISYEEAVEHLEGE